MLNQLVFENLRHRPVRTLLSVAAIALEVAMILTLVGLSHGMIEEAQRRQRGIGLWDLGFTVGLWELGVVGIWSLELGI